jgi:hypothetical protein
VNHQTNNGIKNDAGSRLIFGCLGLGGGWGTGPFTAAHITEAHAAVDAALGAGRCRSLRDSKRRRGRWNGLPGGSGKGIEIEFDVPNL